MDDYRVTPEGTGFQVIKTSPDGRVWLVGRFPTKANAQLWIEDQMNMTNRRNKTGRFANQNSSQDPR
jgi:hypothetical protein